MPRMNDDLLATIIDIARTATPRPRFRPPGECSYCDKVRHEPMAPGHDASARSESGKRPHCTCDVCF